MSKGTTLEQRFDAKVSKDAATGCWNWTASTRSGYGAFGVQGRILGAHRVAYERWSGKIPDGLHIDHLCRNTRCVNPDHLEAVTQAENTRRGALCHASPYFNRDDHVNWRDLATACRKGHEYTPESYSMQRLRDGSEYRRCKVCEKNNRPKVKARLAKMQET